MTHHVELALPYDPVDAGAMHEVADELAWTTSWRPAPTSAVPTGSWARPVYNRDAASRDALRKVKAIFDPNGVMNPGKLCFGPPAVAPVPVGKEA